MGKKANLKTSSASNNYYSGSFHSLEQDLVQNNGQRMTLGFSDLIKNPNLAIN